MERQSPHIEWDEVKIIDTARDEKERGVKEALYIPQDCSSPTHSYPAAKHQKTDAAPP